MKKKLPVYVLEQHIVAEVLLPCTVMKVLAGKPQIKLETWYQALDSLLGRQ